VFGNRLCCVWWFVFFCEFLIPLLGGGEGVCKFLNSYWFLMIFSVPNVPMEGFKFYLDTRNNGALPFDPDCPECLSVRSPDTLPYEPVITWACEVVV